MVETWRSRRNAQGKLRREQRKTISFQQIYGVTINLTNQLGFAIANSQVTRTKAEECFALRLFARMTKRGKIVTYLVPAPCSFGSYYP
jgi:hypothetical protein